MGKPTIKTTFRYEYIEMIEAPRKLKRVTKMWDVMGRRSGGYLGQIRWHGAWRQYCFFPSVSTIFSKGCMKDIVYFVEIQMQLRVQKKEEKKS